jgi:hypothetical protein
MARPSVCLCVGPELSRRIHIEPRLSAPANQTRFARIMKSFYVASAFGLANQTRFARFIKLVHRA